MRAWNNRDATTAKKVPARLVVLGGGVGGTLVANLLDRSLDPDEATNVEDLSLGSDLLDGAFYAGDPHRHFAWLRRHDPVYWDPSGEVWGIAFDPEGSRLASAGDDGVVRVWRTDFEGLACTSSGGWLPQRVWTRLLGGYPWRRTCPGWARP